MATALVDDFYANAWKDDWADLCDALGVAYMDLLAAGDIDSRELRKRVTRWAGEREDGPALVDAAITALA